MIGRIAEENPDLPYEAIQSILLGLQDVRVGNVTEYKSYQAAKQILTEQEHFSLSPEKWNAFCETLDRPARSIPTLHSLLTALGLLDG